MPRSGESPPTLSFLQGNPRPPSLSLQEGSSRPSNLPEGGNPRPSWRLRGSPAPRSWESWASSSLPAPVRAGRGQRDAVGWRLRRPAEPRAPGIAPPAAESEARRCSSGQARRPHRRWKRRRRRQLGDPPGGAWIRTREEQREAPRSRAQVKRPSRCGRDSGLRMGGGGAIWHPRDRASPGKFSDESLCGNPSPGKAVCRAPNPGWAAQTPLVSGRGRAGRGRGRRASERGITRATLLGTLRTGPGAPARARALRPPYLGCRLVLSSRAEVLRCSGLRDCLGVQAPALPHVLPGTLPAEETRG